MKLIDRYMELKDELLDFTEEYHDNMLWDVIGYCEEDEDDIDIDTLKKQVKAFEMMLEAHKLIEYMYS
jgi:hypothetical protein